MICDALCGRPLEKAEAWLRIGPHGGAKLVRLNFHYECAETLAASLSAGVVDAASERH